MDPALRGVDEDEGSPLRNGATHDVDLDTGIALLDQRHGKIERSAEAFRVRHDPSIIPLQMKP